MAETDLFTPSLTATSRAPVFSINAMIATAFFGGAFAVPLLGLENSRRLSRLRKDGLLLLLALLLAAAVLLFMLYSIGMANTSELRSEFRLTSRALGFAYVGLYYWLNRQTYRSLRVMGIEPASPVVVVPAAVLLGVGIALLLYNAAAAGLFWELR